MKNSRTLSLSFISLLFLISTVMLSSMLSGCDSNSAEAKALDKSFLKKNESTFNWLELSGWYTQGTISSSSAIRIVFNRDVVNDELVGKAANNVMYISPAVKGNPVFISKSEVVWQPTEPLQAGASYKVSIKPEGLINVPKNEPPFKFDFRIIPLEFEIQTFGLNTIPNKKGWMTLKGQLLVSDNVDSKSVESVMKARLQSKSLPIEWSHGSQGKRHSFVIKNIKRESFATDLNLSWNGKAINIDTIGEQEIAVPRIDDFKMLNMRVVHELASNPYVQVSFSEELDRTKNTKGLIRLTKNRSKTRINGNVINIYPNKNISGTFKVRIDKKIKAKNGQTLKAKIDQEIVFDDIKPQIKFSGKGSILPENSTLEIPFEAVGVNAVEVTAFEVFPDNMAQFLQVNNLSGNDQIRRTGQYLWRKTIPLTPADPNKWNRYSFDATELMKKHNGGLLRLTISIRREHSSYNCAANTPKSTATSKPLIDLVDNGVVEISAWDGISNQYNDEGSSYDWNKRNDPCTDSYFKYNSEKTNVSQNFIPSNIGLIAKQDGNGRLHVISTDIRSSKPLTGVEFEITNFQGRTLAKSTSDGSGFSTMELSGVPFLLTAKKFKDTAYLKLNNSTALAVSHFAVGGQTINKGLKGFIYGERGVWRPGDDIYLSFVLQESIEDELGGGSKRVPKNHPVMMKLINPQGQVVDTQTNRKSVGGFYAFKFKTEEKAQTGNWMVKAFLGGSTFSKSLMIETVRPNRLKVELSFEGADVDAKKVSVLYSTDGAPKATLFSQWLHGASASNLKADVSVKFSSKRTKFERFTDYTFDDPARSISSGENLLLEGRLDEKGYLKFQKELKPEGDAAGLLKARFTTRVFEEGGAFSISRSSIDYHPYENYVGIKLPKGDATRGMLLTDKTHTVKIAGLTAKGENTKLNVKVDLYKIDWKWWWDKSSESLAQYADGKRYKSILSKKVAVNNGEGEWNFEIKYPEWGRYLIRACDLDGGHCTGKTVYIDWPGWAGRAQEEGSGAASRLSFFSDKKAYTVGETATIQLPASTNGRALMTVETGSQILEQRWIEFTQASASSNSTAKSNERVQFKLPITAAMSPNAYVHITLLQPHKDKNNDRPIRLYGIIPLEVADPNTYLKPKILVDDEWKPASKQKITVSEASGKAMNYTLAVVDEGLLGLTAFRTPNLHRHFYKKEALGIKTWDLFDEIIGAYGGKLERMLALGGGDEAGSDNDDTKKRRFPPVVKFLGPFHLAAGKTAEHEIELPQYLGAVRVMLIAGDRGAYGKADKSVFVRQPLMMQASLPRVLGPNEEVIVPVTLFALDDAIKDVTVTVRTDTMMSANGNAKQHIKFSKRGEKIAFIKLRTGSREGKTQLHFSAVSQSNPEHRSDADIYLDIRRANQETTRTLTKVIEPGASWSGKGDAFGLAGSNQSLLEISSVPALNLDSRLSYLIRYPHGCLEQTTSSVFPQLYLKKVITLDKTRQGETEHNIQKAIERLQRFQTGSGDFSYWPGGKYQNEWASIYAGHFLIEAKKVGYLVPDELLQSWIDFQIDTSQNFTTGSKRYSHTQAYRLYVLALAGQPQMGAMNRLRESSKLNKKARWILASAYQKASQPNAAKSVIHGLSPGFDEDLTDDERSAISVLLNPNAPEDTNTNDTFNSSLGDLGLQLDSLITLGKTQQANQIVEKIAEEMSGDKFQSTQGISWALMAVSRYLGDDTSNFTAKLTQPKGDKKTINSDKAISTTQLTVADNSFHLENTSAVKLFVTLINHGVPKAGSEKALETRLKLDTRIRYRDAENPKEWVKIINNEIPQGRDVVFVVSVKNTSKHNAKNIALTIPVAAGMEILGKSEQIEKTSDFDYHDIRDDRVHYYFSLKKGQRKIFSVLANASYTGKYYLPAINAEAMYDGKLKAREKGKWINIISNRVSDKTPDTTKKEDVPMAAANAVSAVQNAASASSSNNNATIIIKKARLYNGPAETRRSKMFLIKGDVVKVLQRRKASDNTKWLFILYKGKKKTITMWLRAESIE